MKIFKIANQFPFITGVAVIDETGKVWSLPKPNRHHNVIHLIDQNGHKARGEQGFIADGKFIDRKTAKTYASQNGQELNNEQYFAVHNREKVNRDYLFSEDLW